MDDLEDELDLRYHRALKPDVYYRCPSSESLDGALRNELEKNAASLIPVDIVTEFVFGKASTITVPVTQQPHLDTLFEPADYPQSITVEHALCYGIEGKERLKLQRAIARCFIETIQTIDGFNYAERQAWNKEGSDGVRFKYVCLDSLQNRDRKSNGKTKKTSPENADSSNIQETTNGSSVPTYDCGGAIHVRFSTKREAVNVMYVHNPIHRDVESRPADHDSQLHETLSNNGSIANGTQNGAKPKKRKKSKNDHHMEADSAFHDLGLDISASPEASKVCEKETKEGRSSTRSKRVCYKKENEIQASEVTLKSASKGSSGRQNPRACAARQRQMPSLPRERYKVQ